MNAMAGRFGLTPPRIILWGGTGQAKVVRPILEDSGVHVIAVFDDTEGLQAPFSDIPLLHGSRFDEWRLGMGSERIGFSVTIGNPHGRARLRIAERLQGAGLVPVTAVHPTAWIAESAVVGAGCQILAGAIVAVEAVLGRHCIVNTRAAVDHECVIDDAVEIGPGATLTGCVRVGTAAWIAAGATVLPRVRIGADAVVGAGAVVIRDVPANTTVVGVPARAMTRER
jgi:sugar O-acyltransferase (sialic acid O-acetyltransferase NeuD family)